MAQKVTAKTNAAEVERPAEEQAFVSLKTSLETYNSDALTRSALSDKDDDALENLVASSEESQESVQAAWRATESPADGGAKAPPEVVTSVHVRVLDYVNSNRARMRVELSTPDGPSQIETPAIESATMRQAIHRQGQEILEHIEKAIAAGYKRLADHRAAQSKQRSQVEYWMKHAVVRKLVAAVVELHDTLPEASSGGILDTLHSVQRRVASDQERAGRQVQDPLPTALGHCRRWLPVAREILNTQDDGKTKGAA